MLATAAAGELLDVPVFVMDFVDGSVITKSTPAPDNDTRLRRRIGESLVDTLAALHQVAWREVGLGDFGKPDGFNARQLRRMRSLIAVDGALPKPSPRWTTGCTHTSRPNREPRSSTTTSASAT